MALGILFVQYLFPFCPVDLDICRSAAQPLSPDVWPSFASGRTAPYIQTNGMRRVSQTHECPSRCWRSDGAAHWTLETSALQGPHRRLLSGRQAQRLHAVPITYDAQ